MKEKERLRKIDIMKERGFGGYFMHSCTGLETEYLGDEWFRLTNRCAEYGASRLFAWLPCEADIAGLLAGGGDLEIQVALTRRNTFSPLHMLPARANGYDPDSFVTSGERRSDGYVLLLQGLTGAPEFYEIM